MLIHNIALDNIRQLGYIVFYRIFAKCNVTKLWKIER